MTKRPAAWIAFLRGVNVGGKTIVPMKTLVALLEDAGLEDVRHYIQSGNIVFRSNAKSPAVLERRIGEAVAGRFSIDPRAFVLSAAALARAAEANPFPDAVSEPKSLHLFFLAEPPKTPDLDALERVRTPTEAFVLRDAVFYLHAPEGIGRSKLAASVGKRLGVDVTARNWRTVEEVLKLARALG